MLLPPFPVRLPSVDVFITFDSFENGGEHVCCLFLIEGKIAKPPKAWLRMVRTELHKIEQIAKSAGYAEIQLRGRDWSKILPDYEPLYGVPNGLRKRL